nr:unnamed protein product [Digitaria exilis]
MRISCRTGGDRWANAACQEHAKDTPGAVRAAAASLGRNTSSCTREADAVQRPPPTGHGSLGKNAGREMPQPGIEGRIDFGGTSASERANGIPVAGSGGSAAVLRRRLSSSIMPVHNEEVDHEISNTSIRKFILL